MPVKYNFHHQQAKYGYRPTLLFLGGIIGFLVLLIGWTDFVLGLPWYVFVTVIVIWVLAFRYNLKKAGEFQSEEVIFTPEGMQSRLFGDFMYQEVQSFRISLTRAKFFPQSSVPSLLIDLEDGRRIKYDLALKHFKTEAKTFITFIDQFLVELKATHPQACKKGHRQLQKFVHLQKHPSKTLKQIGGWGTAIIIIGVGIGNFIQNNPELFKTDQVKEIRKNVNADFKLQNNKLKQAIVNQGKVYLFSNDTTVTARLFPNMELPKQSYPGGPLLKKSDIASKTKEFLAHQDSLGFHTVLDFGEQIIRQKPMIPVTKKTGSKYLYLTLSGNQKVVNWVISYKDVRGIKDSLNHVFPPFDNVVTHYLRKYPDMNLYISASQNKKTDLNMFKKATRKIKELLTENNVDTKTYHIKVFPPKQ